MKKGIYLTGFVISILAIFCFLVVIIDSLINLDCSSENVLCQIIDCIFKIIDIIAVIVLLKIAYKKGDINLYRNFLIYFVVYKLGCYAGGFVIKSNIYIANELILWIYFILQVIVYFKLKKTLEL